MGRLRYLAWALLASTGMTLSNAAIAQPVPTTPPVAPAELGDGPIDEVAQLERIRSALREHYRPDNDDTRFVIDRNDKGIFQFSAASASFTSCPTMILARQGLVRGQL
jgi:hypothetical protein